MDDKKGGGGKGGKGNSDGEVGGIDFTKKKELDLDKIEKLMPGLAYYKEPTEAQVKEYLAKSDPTMWYNNIWIFLITTIIFILTIISIELKLTPKISYSITKTNESIMRSQGLLDDYDADIRDQGQIFNNASFNTKLKLSNYLVNQFPYVFFNSNSTTW